MIVRSGVLQHDCTEYFSMIVWSYTCTLVCMQLLRSMCVYTVLDNVCIIFNHRCHGSQ